MLTPHANYRKKVLNASDPHLAEPASGDINVAPIFASILARWKVVVLAGFLGVLGAIAYMHAAPKLYTAQLQVIAVDQGGEGNTGRSQLADVASLVGISMSSASQSNFDLYLQGLTSHVGAEQLAGDAQLMHRIFAEEWDQAAGRWRDPSPGGRSFLNSIRSVLGMAQRHWMPPNASRLEQFLAENIQVARDKANPVITITYQGDPALGADLLWRLHQSVDNLLRQRVLERTSSYIQYLMNKLGTITVADYREAVISTLSGQEKTQMVASSHLPFMAEPFGRPTTSIAPTSPSWVVVFLVAIILSTSIGAAFAYWIDQHRPNWVRRNRWL